jgi:hypothetical protein
MLTFEIDHPDGLYCPECGCGKIHYWPEIKDWKKWNDKKKKSYEKCAACGYTGEEE